MYFPILIVQQTETKRELYYKFGKNNFDILFFYLQKITFEYIKFNILLELFL